MEISMLQLEKNHWHINIFILHGNAVVASGFQVSFLFFYSYWQNLIPEHQVRAYHYNISNPNKCLVYIHSVL